MNFQDPETPATPPSNRAALLIVFLVVFIDLLGFGIVLPLLPRYGDDYLKELFPGGKESVLGGICLGALLSSFSLMQFVFAPIWGRVSDRVGRRPILLMGLGGSVAFYTLFGVASEMENLTLGLALLFAARIGAGIAGATISTAQAVIADSTAPEKRSHGMALVGIAFGIGFTFGPLLGAGATVLFPDHKGAAGFAAAGFSLVALLLGLAKLPETLKPGAAPRPRRWLDWQGMQNVIQMPAIGALVGIFFLATFAFGNFEATLSLLNRDFLQLPDDKNFLLFAYVGLVLMLTQGLIYRRLAGRVGEVAFMKVGLGLMVLGLLSGLGLLLGGGQLEGAARLIAYMLDLAVIVAGFALLTPSVQSLISRLGDPARQGEILGVNQSASAMARILGPAVALPLFKLESSRTLPYLLGAVLLVVVFLLTLKLEVKPAAQES